MVHDVKFVNRQSCAVTVAVTAPRQGKNDPIYGGAIPPHGEWVLEDSVDSVGSTLDEKWQFRFQGPKGGEALVSKSWDELDDLDWTLTVPEGVCGEEENGGAAARGAGDPEAFPGGESGSALPAPESHQTGTAL